MGTGFFPVGSWIFLIFVIMTYLDIAKAIYCYRCDNFNHGSTCDAEPATRHLRDYGEEETCLQFEEVNEQFLALQKDLDSPWYYSPKNGDHGLPVHILLPENPPGDVDDRGSLTLVHADRDLACLFVRSTFHHEIDSQINDNAPPVHPPHTVYFRKCIQLPSLDIYPICRKATIYKGDIELCVCRTDKCNFNHIDNPSLDSRVLVSGSSKVGSAIPFSTHLPSKLYLYLFTTIISYLLLK